LLEEKNEEEKGKEGDLDDEIRIDWNTTNRVSKVFGVSKISTKAGPAEE
jgi:hypothetical protein